MKAAPGETTRKTGFQGGPVDHPTVAASASVQGLIPLLESLVLLAHDQSGEARIVVGPYVLRKTDAGLHLALPATDGGTLITNDFDSLSMEQAMDLCLHCLEGDFPAALKQQATTIARRIHAETARETTQSTTGFSRTTSVDPDESRNTSNPQATDKAPLDPSQQDEAPPTRDASQESNPAVKTAIPESQDRPPVETPLTVTRGGKGEARQAHSGARDETDTTIRKRLREAEKGARGAEKTAAENVKKLKAAQTQILALETKVRDLAGAAGEKVSHREARARQQSDTLRAQLEEMTRYAFALRDLSSRVIKQSGITGKSGQLVKSRARWRRIGLISLLLLVLTNLDHIPPLDRALDQVIDSARTYVSDKWKSLW